GCPSCSRAQQGMPMSGLSLSNFMATPQKSSADSCNSGAISWQCGARRPIVRCMAGPLAHLVAYKGLIVGLWFAGLFLAERIRPASPLPDIVARAPISRLARNLALAAINFLLSPLIVLPLTALAAGHTLAWRPSWWGGWLGLGLDL